MGLISVNIPQVGAPRETEESDTTSTLTTVVSAINGGLDNANLSGSAGITDANLASPTNPAWKTVSEARGLATASVVTGANQFFVQDGGPAVVSGGAITGVPALVRVANDHAIAGKTTKIRLQCEVIAGGALPGGTVTFALAPMTLGASTLVIGTSYGATCQVTPAPNASVDNVGTEVTLSATGVYVFYFGTSMGWSPGTGIWFRVGLQVRNV